MSKLDCTVTLVTTLLRPTPVPTAAMVAAAKEAATSLERERDTELKSSPDLIQVI